MIYCYLVLKMAMVPFVPYLLRRSGRDSEKILEHRYKIRTFCVIEIIFSHLPLPRMFRGHAADASKLRGSEVDLGT